MVRDSMVFYASFYDAAANISDAERLQFYDAITLYGIKGEAPDVSGVVAALFSLVKPQIDANNTRYTSGKSGGRPPTKKAVVSDETAAAKPTVSVKSESKKPMVSKSDDVKKPKEKGEMPPQAETGLSDIAYSAVCDWVTYKTERKEQYKPTGLRALISEVRNKEATHGGAAVADVIRLSMANGWKGVVWDRLKQAAPIDSGLNGYEQAWADRVKNHIKGECKNDGQTMDNGR